MSSRLGLRLLALLLPATSLLLPAAAHAERAVTHDATEDVVSVGIDPSLVLGEEEPVAAPANQSADITRTVVDHTAGRVLVSVSVRDLRNTFGETVVLRVRTPQRTRTVLVDRRGKHAFSMLFGGRNAPTCGGLSATADSQTDKILMTVPTSCIDDPRWVQVAVLVAGSRVDHDPDTGDRITTFIDDAHSEGFDDDRRPAFGPQVRRG